MRINNTNNTSPSFKANFVSRLSGDYIKTLKPEKANEVLEGLIFLKRASAGIGRPTNNLTFNNILNTDDFMLHFETDKGEYIHTINGKTGLVVNIRKEVLKIAEEFFDEIDFRNPFKGNINQTTEAIKALNKS